MRVAAFREDNVAAFEGARSGKPDSFSRICAGSTISIGATFRLWRSLPGIAGRGLPKRRSRTARPLRARRVVLQSVLFVLESQPFQTAVVRPEPAPDAADASQPYFSSISRKAYSKALALMTSCSTPALRK